MADADPLSDDQPPPTLETTASVPPTTAASSSSGIRWQDHLPLVVAGTLAVITALRLVRVAHSNPDTAFALLSYVGTTHVITAELLQTLPAFIAGVTIGLIVGYKRKSKRIPALAFASAAIAIQLAPWPMIALVAGIFLLHWAGVRFLTWRFRVTGNTTESPRFSLPQMVAINGFFVMFMLLGPDTVWLPTQAITERQGAHIVGYVLSSDGHQLVVLKDEDRTVIRIDRAVIKDQIFCTRQRAGWDWQKPSLISIGFRDKPVSYPPCGKSNTP